MKKRISSLKRLALSVVVIAAAFGAVTADAADMRSFDIPPGELSAALKSLAKQTGLELIFQPGDLKGIKTQGVKGVFSPQDAVARLIDGTKLTIKTDQAGAILITPARTSALAPFSDGKRAEPGEREDAGLRLARADNSSNTADRENNRSPATVEGKGKGDKNTELQEIVVTAQKRLERLQDVPMPVAAVSAEKLAASNQLRLQDYYNKIPGLALAAAGDGNGPLLAIRGITTGGNTNPTVGIVVDEVPYGSTINIGTTAVAPDIDPGDLARIEVLRGPQGTLYGASTMGGLLKFVTVDPTTDAFGGSVQSGVTSVREGDDLGYTFRGAVNVPLGETLAVRLSGFKTRDPGYVDNVQTGESDINKRDNDGARLTALWRPSESLSVKLSAVVQDNFVTGATDVDRTFGGELSQRALRGTGSYRKRTNAYGATVRGQLGKVELVSATGYSVDEQDTNTDYAANAAILTLASQSFGVSAARGPLHREAEKFTQEIRATIPLSERVTWLLGGFYTDEDTTARLDALAVNPATNVVAGTVYTIVLPTPYRELAGFTNLTFEINDRLDVQVGGRYGRNDQSYAAFRSGPFALRNFGSDPSNISSIEADGDAFTYLVTPRWKVSPALMLYARVTSGYRPGGTNANCGLTGVACTFDPDTTRNYEIGVKGSALGNMLSYEGSLYYIDWQDLQLSLAASGLSFQGNGSRAKSQGTEISLESRPLKGTTISTWIAWNDAVLTERFPVTSTAAGRPGDRLPLSAEWSGSLSLDQEFSLGPGAMGFLGSSVSYVGKRRGLFKSAALIRESYPDYTQWDLRAGVRFDSWTINAFVNNVTDTRGILRQGLDSARSTFLTYIQPRTVGVNLSYSW